MIRCFHLPNKNAPTSEYAIHPALDTAQQIEDICALEKTAVLNVLQDIRSALSKTKIHVSQMTCF